MPSTTTSSGDSSARPTEIRFAVRESSLGHVLVALSDRGVCAILLGEDAEELVAEVQRRFPDAALLGEDAETEQAASDVVRFVENPCGSFDLPLDMRGTEFQLRVWDALREIPPGTTQSYKTVAERIGAPTATRAVAGACGANSLAVVVPCHRVVRTDGGLSGYRWGTDRKAALIERERLCRAKQA